MEEHKSCKQILYLKYYYEGEIPCIEFLGNYIKLLNVTPIEIMH